MFCTNCGTSNKDDEKLCIQCGEPLIETEIKKKPFGKRILKKADFLQDTGHDRAGLTVNHDISHVVRRGWITVDDH